MFPRPPERPLWKTFARIRADDVVAVAAFRAGERLERSPRENELASGVAESDRECDCPGKYGNLSAGWPRRRQHLERGDEVEEDQQRDGILGRHAEHRRQ